LIYIGSILVISISVLLYRLAYQEPRVLKEVVEPIKFERWFTQDDGGSYGLYFKDSRGVGFEFGLYMNGSDEIHSPSNLLLKVSRPDGRIVRQHIPLGGVEERQLLELLTRWQRGITPAERARDGETFGEGFCRDLRKRLGE
jgi:hypothetical protein